MLRAPSQQTDRTTAIKVVVLVDYNVMIMGKHTCTTSEYMYFEHKCFSITEYCRSSTLTILLLPVRLTMTVYNRVPH